jgi:hypothetical protein
MWVLTKPLITEEIWPGGGLNLGLPNDTQVLYSLRHELMLMCMYIPACFYLGLFFSCWPRRAFGGARPSSHVLQRSGSFSHWYVLGSLFPAILNNFERKNRWICWKPKLWSAFSAILINFERKKSEIFSKTNVKIDIFGDYGQFWAYALPSANRLGCSLLRNIFLVS